MPTLNLYTNIPVDAVTATDILKDATKAVSKIIGKPESVESLAFLLLLSSIHHLYCCFASLFLVLVFG
ncbi:unnamed protein product [Rhodiola kirilowii]